MLSERLPSQLAVSEGHASLPGEAFGPSWCWAGCPRLGTEVVVAVLSASGWHRGSSADRQSWAQYYRGHICRTCSTQMGSRTPLIINEKTQRDI